MFLHIQSPFWILEGFHVSQNVGFVCNDDFRVRVQQRSHNAVPASSMANEHDECLNPVIKLENLVGHIPLSILG